MDGKQLLVFYLGNILVATLVGCLFVRPATALVNSRISTVPKIREPSYLQAITLLFLAQCIAAIPTFSFAASPELFGVDLRILTPIAYLFSFTIYVVAFGSIFATMVKTSLAWGLAVALTHALMQLFVVAGCVFALLQLSN